MHFLITHLQTPRSMSDLARMLGMSKQQMTKLADKVIDMGMARRVNHPEDRRVILLEATDKAKAYMKESEAKTREHFHRMFDEMGGEDEMRFLEALSIMNEVFGRMDERERKNN